MKDFLNTFEHTKIAVKCDTKEKAKLFMDYLSNLGVEKVMSESNIDYEFGTYANHLAYAMNRGYLSYCDYDWYIGEGCKIIDVESVIKNKCELCDCYNICDGGRCSK